MPHPPLKVLFPTVSAVAGPGRLHKSLSTDSTLVILLPFVSLHVHAQACLLHEHLRAASTLEFFHASVHSFMFISGVVGSETFFTAFSALEWSLSCVQCDVAFQFLFFVELLLTMITSEDFC